MYAFNIQIGKKKIKQQTIILMQNRNKECAKTENTFGRVRDSSQSQNKKEDGGLCYYDYSFFPNVPV